MRKNQQLQILELLKTVEEAQAAGLYADCQQAALTAGEFIETFEGEGTATVALLEDYCELLYKASNGEVTDKALRKQFIKIENSVKNELKQKRLEAVFISYKASMSDSLLSIYLAAKEDPDCDAFWMPVPYYVRNVNLTFNEMHFEGQEYYDNAGNGGGKIECTDWQKYDFETRRPDIIFTFAPYDELNYVTSVHPAFYCKRLRELTDLLVYVPYFVWDTGYIPESFCGNAGCVFSHKVIVQSEKLRGDYIKHYWNLHGDKFGDPDERFIALGSPKFDKVLFSKREDYELPEEWAKLLRHNGASETKRPSKKAILYNTTVAAILNGGEYYMKKIRSVLSAFKERDDVVLWWRPHPLSESTYKSMRPQWYARYAQIVEEYKDEGWGIYDDTPDLHRSIALTDAYLGDGSSVLTLYKATGKPCMVQCLDEHLYNFIRVAADTDNASLCCAHRFNALFHIDKRSGKFKQIGAFPGEYPDETSLYVYGAAAGGKIFFAPYRAGSIAVYDVKAGSFELIPIRDDVKLLAGPEMDFRDGCKFLRAYKYNDYIYLSPAAYPAVARINTKTHEVEYFDDFIPQLPEYYKLPPQNAVYMFGESAVNGSELIIPTRRGNALVFFDMKTCKSKVIREITEELPDDAVASNVAFDGSNCWILYPYLKQVVCWDMGGKAPETVYKDSGNIRPIVMACACGHIWLSSPDISLKIDTRTKEISEAHELLCGFDNPGEGFAASITGGDDGMLRYTTSNGLYCECAVGDNRLTRKINLYDNIDIAGLRHKLISQAAEHILPGRGCIYEQPVMNAGDFIDAVANGELAGSSISESYTVKNPVTITAGKPAGAVIYEAMRGVVYEK